MAVVVAACGGGGGGDPQLNQGVTLNANYTVVTRVTGIQGTCPGVNVGDTDTETLTLTQSGNIVTVGAGTPEAFSGTLSGARARFVQNLSQGTVTLTGETNVTFAADGSTFQGTGRSVETDSATGVTCTESFTINGTRVASGGGGGGGGGGAATAQAFFDGASIGATAATFQSSALPTPNGGPSVMAAGSSSVPLGGTTAVTVTPGASIDAVAIGVEGATGYFLAPLTATTGPQTVLLQLSQTIPNAAFRCVYQGRSGGSFGPLATVDVTRRAVGTGVLQIALSWDSRSDVDLHVVEPTSPPFEIFYGDGVSPTGGELDLDANADCLNDGTNENITWAVNETPSTGEYIVRVENFENCQGQASNYVVRVNRPGQAPLIRTGSFLAGDPGTFTGAGGGVEVVRFTR